MKTMKKRIGTMRRKWNGSREDEDGGDIAVAQVRNGKEKVG
jgi:hypothetical protein